jgi:hypothetical protein
VLEAAGRVSASIDDRLPVAANGRPSVGSVAGPDSGALTSSHVAVGTGVGKWCDTVPSAFRFGRAFVWLTLGTHTMSARFITAGISASTVCNPSRGRRRPGGRRNGTCLGPRPSRSGCAASPTPSTPRTPPAPRCPTPHGAGFAVAEYVEVLSTQGVDTPYWTTSAQPPTKPPPTPAQRWARQPETTSRPRLSNRVGGRVSVDSFPTGGSILCGCSTCRRHPAPIADEGDAAVTAVNQVRGYGVGAAVWSSSITLSAVIFDGGRSMRCRTTRSAAARRPGPRRPPSCGLADGAARLRWSWLIAATAPPLRRAEDPCR